MPLYDTSDPDFAEALAFEQRKSVVQLAHFRREAARSSGVSFGGLGPTPPVEVQVHDMVAAATAAYERDAEWKASPKGRLSFAIHAIGQLGYAHTAERMRGAYNRGISMEAKPSLQTLGFLLTELASIPLIDAGIREPFQSATRAIADMLSISTQEAA